MASPMTGVQRLPQRTRNPAAKNSAPKTRMDGSKKPNWTITARSATPVYTSPANITRIANGFCRRPPTRSDVASMSPLGAPHSGFRISTLRRAAVDKQAHRSTLGSRPSAAGTGERSQTSFKPTRLAAAVRAIRFEAGGGVKLVDVAKPGPGPQDVLVHVLAAGGCWNGPPPPPQGQGRGDQPPLPRPQKARRGTENRGAVGPPQGRG